MRANVMTGKEAQAAIDKNQPLPAGLTLVDGNLDLYYYSHSLPSGLKSVGGSLEIAGYSLPLPAGLKSVGGDLKLGYYRHPLPKGLKSVDGDMWLWNYRHPLPEGLTSVGGRLLVQGYPYPLPAGLKSIGSFERRSKDSILEYEHLMPAGLKSLGGNLNATEYGRPLPEGLKSVGGNLYIYQYPYPLPAGLTSVGGDLVGIYGHDHPLPKKLKSVGGALELANYGYPLPASLTSVGGKLDPSGYLYPLPPELAKKASLTYEFVDGKWSRRILKEHYSISAPTTRGFRTWFEGSKATSADNRPLVVYHGTPSPWFGTKFDKFKIDSHHPGFYFTNNLEVANTYLGAPGDAIDDPLQYVSESGVGRSGVFRVYLRMRNPLVIDAEGSQWNNITNHPFGELRRTYEIATEAAKLGYDGVIFKNLYDEGNAVYRKLPMSDIYVVFDPNQVKSALFNSGKYSLDDDDLRRNPRMASRRPFRKTSRRARTSRRRS